MSFEELVKKVSPTLKRITYKLNGHHASFNHEDLCQEALLYLWLEYKAGTWDDKTQSYILQGCYFHLKNFIRTHADKASLVSIEASRNQEDEDFDLGEALALKACESSRDLAHCVMLIEQIRNNGLTPREKEVFNLSLEGLTVREIGARMGISHVMVVKLSKTMRQKCLGHMDR